MSGFLADKEPAVGIEDLIREDDIFEANRFPADEKWSTLLRPAGAGSPAFMEDREEALPLDLNTLLKVLDQHNTSEESDSSSWQLVVIQCLLLLALVFLSVFWACCCKKRCFHSAPPSVQAALRKLSSSSLKSRDFPPSYSQADLHTLAMSVHDYLYPPPDYPDVFSRRSPDELAYLDLEAGHTRLAKLSFSGSSAVLQGLPGLSRQASTLSSESRKSSLNSTTGSRKNSIMKDPNSRRSSTSQDSRRSSRISFSEEVECSNGSVRRLSGHQDLSRKASSSSLSSSSSGSSADTSRRSSLLLSRKLGLSQETLDKELRKKLESIEQEDGEVKEERKEMERRDRKDSNNINLDTVVEIEKY